MDENVKRKLGEWSQKVGSDTYEGPLLWLSNYQKVNN